LAQMIVNKLDLESCTLAYKRREGNPCVVFLHGLSGSKEYFDTAFENSSLHGMGLLTIDIPGFGESEVFDGDYSLPTQAQRLCSLIRSLHETDVFLLGHSYAGPICHIIAKLLPSRIKGVILAESSFKPKKPSWAAGIASQTLDEYKDAFTETCLNSYKFYEEGLVDKSEKNVLILVDALRKTSAEAMYFSSKELVKYCESVNLIDSFASLDIPVCYLISSVHKDSLTTNPVLQELLQTDIEIKEVNNSGHCMMLDNPSLFYDRIASFVHEKGQ
jgi:pimeloyl-ACP methyl ester carboxylesterase